MSALTRDGISRSEAARAAILEAERLNRRARIRAEAAARHQSADQVILAALAAMSRDERRRIAGAEARDLKHDSADLAEVRAIQQEMADRP